MVGTALVMAAFVPQIAFLLKTRRAGVLSVKSNAINMIASISIFGTVLVIIAYIPQITHLIKIHCGGGVSIMAYVL